MGKSVFSIADLNKLGDARFVTAAILMSFTGIR